MVKKVEWPIALTNLDVQLVDSFLGINVSGGLDGDDVRVFVEDVEHDGTVVLARGVFVKLESNQGFGVELFSRHRMSPILFEKWDDVHKVENTSVFRA